MFSSWIVVPILVILLNVLVVLNSFVVLNQYVEVITFLLQFASLTAKKQSASPMVVLPKYNNYLQNSDKFDPYSHVLIPIDLLGIKPPQKGIQTFFWNIFFW